MIFRAALVLPNSSSNVAVVEPIHAKLAFFPLGQVTLKLIEPIGGPSTIKGMAERVTALVILDLLLVKSGNYEGGRYAYLDRQQRYGAVVELPESVQAAQ
jgi:methylmalonyl-CoA/ethylmalonyl-CoA epimerase